MSRLDIRMSNPSYQLGHTYVQPLLSAWTYVCPTPTPRLDIRMSNHIGILVAWTYVCPTPVVSLDIRMSNLDIRMSKLTMLFDIFVSNFSTNGSTKFPKKHPKCYTQSWIFGSFGFPRFQYHLGHHPIHIGLDIRMSNPCYELGHTYVQPLLSAWTYICPT